MISQVTNCQYQTTSTTARDITLVQSNIMILVVAPFSNPGRYHTITSPHLLCDRFLISSLRTIAHTLVQISSIYGCTIVNLFSYTDRETRYRTIVNVHLIVSTKSGQHRNVQATVAVHICSVHKSLLSSVRPTYYTRSTYCTNLYCKLHAKSICQNTSQQ